jgi:hypothetical protein
MKAMPAGAILRAMPVRSRLLAISCALLCLGAPVGSHAATSGSGERVNVRQGAVASVGGLWCGAGLLSEFSLEIAQHLQNVEGKLVRKGRVREITGHVEGSLVKVDPQRDHTMELRIQGDELRIIGATGVLALATGQSFTRAAGASCTS